MPAVDSGQVAVAYRESKKQKSEVRSTRSLKIMLVVLDCIFLGMQPVLVHMSKNSNGGYSFNPVSINLLTEITKTAFALATLLYFGTGRPGPPMYRSLKSFISDAKHNHLLAVPAGLYAINNYLKFAMQLYFKPTATKMLGNLKIFVIAMMLRVVMRRHFTLIQWEALFLLVAGITVNQLANCSASASVFVADVVPFLPAVMCTLGTITVPSAASVYNEAALKKHMDTSVHLQNFFLYFYGLCFNAAGVLAVSFYKGVTISEMFAGLSTVTWLLVANNTCQGILSSFFYKFADTILKKYSSTIATIFTAVMSYALFGHELTMNFFIGVSIVFISMHQFFTFNKETVALAQQGEGVSGKMIYSPSLDHINLVDKENYSNNTRPWDAPAQGSPLKPGVLPR